MLIRSRSCSSSSCDKSGRSKPPVVAPFLPPAPPAGDAIERAGSKVSCSFFMVSMLAVRLSKKAMKACSSSGCPIMLAFFGLPAGVDDEVLLSIARSPPSSLCSEICLSSASKLRRWLLFSMSVAGETQLKLDLEPGRLRPSGVAGTESCPGRRVASEKLFPSNGAAPWSFGVACLRESLAELGRRKGNVCPEESSASQAQVALSFRCGWRPSCRSALGVGISRWMLRKS
mmetsp:Transcript_23649/g.42797  ORF Transcript_23649/g.42797 Transcript_23649/m.42797 type:complete len:230 (-) Transcript_23649:62-751(-)